MLTIACGYFSYRTLAAIQVREFDWQRNWWDTLTWLVWTILAAGAISEVRCWRERLLFAVLFLQFLMGCCFSFSSSASFDLIREGRWVSLLLWLSATTLGIAVLFGSRKKTTAGSEARP